MERVRSAAQDSEQAAHSRASAWALEVFDRSLKKRQKLDMLLRMLGPLDGQRCLLVTCGDNPGALNHHFRSAGGSWTWAEVEPERIDEMSALLQEQVHHVAPERFPFADGAFDRVVIIDVHEHLEEHAALNAEIARVVAPGGLALLTTPNGDTRLPLAILKRLLGMTPAVYGHVVQGYTAAQLEEMARSAGLVPEGRGAYSKFFTEGIELVINFGYVKVLGKGAGEQQPKDGEIAPTSADDLQRVGGAYRIYAKFYPLLRAISKLDRIIPGRSGYAVAIAARKPR